MRLRIFLVPENRKISTKVANPDKVELNFEDDGEGPKAKALQRLSLVGSA